jgi:hypothetical protein
MAGGKMAETQNLKYLDAAHVAGDGLPLSGLRIETGADRQLGELDGVIVEPGVRRLRYFVVDAGEGRYLMPFDAICFDADHHALRVIAGSDPSSWEAFDPAAYDEFGDDDLITALFARPAA